MRTLGVICALAIGCTATRPCAKNTVYLDMLFDTASAAADSLDVGLAVDGGPIQHIPKTRAAGRTKDTLRIDFANAYPVGSSLRVIIIASESGSEVGSGDTTFKLVSGCTAANIAIKSAAASTDMSLDLSGMEDFALSDLATYDLAGVDLVPLPSCTVSATCPDSFPVCDSTLMLCRACTGAADDSVCQGRSSSTPHCKLSGTNAGQCVACNLSADCPQASPVCNPDGTCRLCSSHSDCASGICNLYGGPSNGQCVDQSKVVYVNSTNDPGQSSCSETGKDGSQAHPFCLIADALTLAGLQSQLSYVLLAGSNNPYDQFEIQNGTFTFVGPGRNAVPPATIQAVTNQTGVWVDPVNSSQVAAVAIDGVAVVGSGASGSAHTVFCDGSSGGTARLTVMNSSLSGGAVALRTQYCELSISRSDLSNAITGLILALGSTYSVQNCFFFGNGTGVTFVSTNGSFSFNTIAYNTTTTGIDCGTTSTASIENSIVFGNKQNAGTQFNNGTQCSLVSVATGADTIGGAGQIPSPAPVLVGTTDLHLDTTAGANLTANQGCCIDKIMNGPNPTPSPLPVVDIDGTKRPKGVAWDIGAHEAM
jgi:hypothetical protein